MSKPIYVVNKITGELAGCVRTMNDAILRMAEFVNCMADARLQFVLTHTRPKRAAPMVRRVGTMPWGRFEGCSFDCVPWRYLDKCLTLDLEARDPMLYDSIRKYLETVDEWQDEQQYRADENHRRDFVPSEFRGK